MVDTYNTEPEYRQDDSMKSLDDLLTEVKDRTDGDLAERLSEAIDADKRALKTRYDNISRIWNQIREIEEMPWPAHDSDDMAELLKLKQKLAKLTEL